MYDRELLSWAIPIRLFAGRLRRHLVKSTAWEVEVNVVRLISDWTTAVQRALADLCWQAGDWAAVELNTIDGLLWNGLAAGHAFEEALASLDSVSPP